METNQPNASTLVIHHEDGNFREVPSPERTKTDEVEPAPVHHLAHTAAPEVTDGSCAFNDAHGNATSLAGSRSVEGNTSAPQHHTQPNEVEAHLTALQTSHASNVECTTPSSESAGPDYPRLSAVAAHGEVLSNSPLSSPEPRRTLASRLIGGQESDASSEWSDSDGASKSGDEGQRRALPSRPISVMDSFDLTHECLNLSRASSEGNQSTSSLPLSPSDSSDVEVHQHITDVESPSWSMDSPCLRQNTASIVLGDDFEATHVPTSYPLVTDDELDRPAADASVQNNASARSLVVEPDPPPLEPKTPESILLTPEEQEAKRKEEQEMEEKWNASHGYSKENWEKEKKRTLRKMFSKGALQQHNVKQVTRLQSISKKKAQSVSSTDSRPVSVSMRPRPKIDPSVAATRIQKIYRGHTARKAYKRIIRRGFVVRELLDTEQSYVKLLRILYQWYIKPLTTGAMQTHEYIVPVISMGEIEAIFSRATEIYDVHRELLEKMQDRFDHWHREQLLGDLFLNMTSTHMDVYTSYVNNYDYSTETLNALRTQGHFKKFLDDRREFHGIRDDLSDLLIAPVQRIPRYSLLLEQILKFTPRTHPDYDNLNKALVTIKGVAEGINERKRSKQLVEELATKITGTNEPIAIVSRYMVLASDMLEVSRAKLRRLFLMNDVILCTTPFTPWSFLGRDKNANAKINYQYKFMVPITECDVSVAEVTKQSIRVQTMSQANANYGFPVVIKALVQDKPETFVFLMKSEKERSLWIDKVAALKSAVSDSPVVNRKGTFKRNKELLFQGVLKRGTGTLSRPGSPLGSMHKPSMTATMNSASSPDLLLERRISGVPVDRAYEIQKNIDVETNILNGLLSIKKVHEFKMEKGQKDRSIKKKVADIDKKIALSSHKLEELRKELNHVAHTQRSPASQHAASLSSLLED
eukprot:comp22157_c0_seq1/m.32478 comp22157_c0_seq1/g.32478  ORF comp22157_c0_seq1/g.32478 comp22157_c0_seq1/m.32478 type:complete len:927 (-) comp22157_c0_seq1:206-2986(-)